MSSGLNVGDTLERAVALRERANDQRGEVAALAERFAVLAARRDAKQAPTEAPVV